MLSGGTDIRHQWHISRGREYGVGSIFKYLLAEKFLENTPPGDFEKRRHFVPENFCSRKTGKFSLIKLDFALIKLN